MNSSLLHGSLYFVAVANPHLSIFFPLLFRENGNERGREGEGDKERETSMGDTLIGCLLNKLQPGPGIEPATQICAFDWELHLQSFR